MDIGWNGTIQKFLRDSFGNRPDYPDVHGWYFAFVAAMHGDFGMGTGLLARRMEPQVAKLEDREDLTPDFVITAARMGIGNMRTRAAQLPGGRLDLPEGSAGTEIQLSWDP